MAGIGGMHPPPHQRRRKRSLIIVHWNMTYAVPYWWDQYIAGVPKDPLPDIVLITNPTLRNDLPLLAAALGPDYKAVRCGIFALVTRMPIIQKGVASLNIPGYAGPIPEAFGVSEGEPGSGDRSRTDFLPEWSPIPRLGSNIVDPGNAMFARIDASSKVGREIVIWGMDMPSEPRMWRMESARAASAAPGQADARRPAQRDGAPQFQPPDIILGDFKHPRGSASLGC